MIPRSGDHVVYVAENGEPKEALVLHYDVNRRITALVFIHNAEIQVVRGVPDQCQRQAFYWCWPQEYAPAE